MSRSRLDKVDMSIFEEIHPGRRFGSSSSYNDLVARLKELIEQDIIKEVIPSIDLSPSLGERWFMENSSGVIYRLLGPDFPDMGEWSEVEFPNRGVV